jgi:GT2 family glycosyltransferase
MSKKKSKKKPAQKAKPKKPETPKGWVVGAKVVSTVNEKMYGTITDPDVSASDFWKNAPAETMKRMAAYSYVRFVREDGATFGVRKDMLRLVED